MGCLQGLGAAQSRPQTPQRHPSYLTWQISIFDLCSGTYLGRSRSIFSRLLIDFVCIRAHFLAVFTKTYINLFADIPLSNSQCYLFRKILPVLRTFKSSRARGKSLKCTKLPNVKFLGLRSQVGLQQFRTIRRDMNKVLNTRSRRHFGAPISNRPRRGAKA